MTRRAWQAGCCPAPLWWVGRLVQAVPRLVCFTVTGGGDYPPGGRVLAGMSVLTMDPSYRPATMSRRRDVIFCTRGTAASGASVATPLHAEGETVWDGSMVTDLCTSLFPLLSPLAIILLRFLCSS